ncbi:MAG TPA: hypothetical protein VHH36_08010, partial [Candidatus Thermoplasmatota archaeon]|nr:hypothetical protein [Candidatus Thermoplasmatota archaeon]
MHTRFRIALLLAATAALAVPGGAALSHVLPDPEAGVLPDVAPVPLVARFPPGTTVEVSDASAAVGLTFGPGTFLGVNHTAPLTEASAAGFGPGPRPGLALPRPIENGCTANWVWKDQAGKLYLGTAGHCLLRAGHATHGGDADADVSRVRVYACPHPCPVGGFAALEASNTPLRGVWFELGPVAYARQADASGARTPRGPARTRRRAAACSRPPARRSLPRGT